MAVTYYQNPASVELVRVEEFPSDARRYQFGETDDYIITASDGRVSSASPCGWDWVIESTNARIRIEGCRVLGDQTGWPSFSDDQYYLI